MISWLLILKRGMGASLVAQWLGMVGLPVQGTPVQSLFREDPTDLQVTRLLCHSY